MENVNINGREEDGNERQYLFKDAPISSRQVLETRPSSAATRSMKYDDILQSVGQIGPFQVWNLLILCLCIVVSAMVIMSPVFTLTSPAHRCAVPELENDTYTVQGPWHQTLIEATLPSDNVCDVYDLTNTSELDPGAGNNSLTTENCDRWVYDKSKFDSSIITEFDLVCDKTYIRASSNMGMFAGSFAGNFVFGILADIIGRKPSLLASLLISSLSNVLLAFMPDLVSVIVVRCMQGFSFQLFAIAATTSMELVGPDWRTVAGMGTHFAWSGGTTLVLPLAYLVPEWRKIYLALGVAAFLVLIATSFTAESPRWLLGKGRIREARRIIESIAESNKKHLPSGTIGKDAVDEGPQVKIWELFGHRKFVIQTLIIFFNWFAMNVVYYGLALNVDNVPGDVYMNYFLACVAEGAGNIFAIIFLDRLGRKGVHILAMWSGGLACIGVIVPVLWLPEDYSWVISVLAMVARMAGSCCYATLYILTVELFPTVVRNSALALCFLFENAAGMVSPYVADLGRLVGGNLSQALPMLVFGALSLVAGALSTQLPETLGRDLPETLEDALFDFDKM